MTLTLLESVAIIYEGEKQLWRLRDNKATNETELHYDDTLMGSYTDRAAAMVALDAMSRNASMVAALRWLARNELPADIVEAGMNAIPASGTEATLNRSLRDAFADMLHLITEDRE